MQIFNFELLDQYKEEHRERSTKLSEYLKAWDDAKSRLRELEKQYEHTFTESVGKGEDKTAELAKIDDDITLQKEVIARRERDYKLAMQALPVVEISPVQVVNTYRSEFCPKVQSEYVPTVQAKLDLARDLLKSALIDHHRISDEYDPLYAEMKEMSQANKTTGRTRYIEGVIHPTKYFEFFGGQGVPSGISRLFGELRDYSGKIDQIKQDADADFYIAVAPKTTKKVGK
ncbi:hypothetical protein [Lysinibacillus fusiformis]|uniref:Uncharacterized protein n=1 Tax=Lysinibacillus fusiformis TaxID=28031 RepID=A0A2I0UVA7_9BACI|nr:hypothetical protein [Lysinibacillus fusiformis]PKU49956.1 hypothetical protein CRI88_20435 [Lysinibacillus fusiformis]